MLETICETLIEAYKRNWITSRDGNVSIRHHDRDHFYITPSGVRKQTLQPDQFKKIEIVERDQPFWQEIPYTDISTNLKPSGEIPLHFGLQRRMGQHRDDVRVVVHLHPTYCVAAMHRGIELSELVRNFPELSRYTRVGVNVPDVAPHKPGAGRCLFWQFWTRLRRVYHCRHYRNQRARRGGHRHIPMASI